MKVKAFFYLWEISMPELLPVNSAILKSPYFYGGDGHNFRCYLTAYGLNANLKTRFGACNVCFNIDSESDTEVDFNVELSIIDKARKKVNVKEKVAKINKTCNALIFVDFITSQFCSSNYKNIVYDGTLKILCTVSIFNKYDINSNLSNDHSKLSLSGFFNSSKLSDFTIIVDTVEVPVHKIILSTRSSVFYAMFNSDVVETQSNTLKINDFRLEVVKEMLRYIYTDTYLFMADMAVEMYMIADKYDIIDLKNISENHLIQTISVDNSCKYLVLADTYSNDTLKKYCLEFIITNGKEVFKKNDWKNFVFEHPLLVESLLKMSLKVEE
uniref:BTB domain-containing protein n=1 Tax=Strongyloides stercoralis TaxID=6248 RepID=A0A0K0E8B7_STRER